MSHKRQLSLRLISFREDMNRSHGQEQNYVATFLVIPQTNKQDRLLVSPWPNRSGFVLEVLSVKSVSADFTDEQKAAFLFPELPFPRGVA